MSIEEIKDRVNLTKNAFDKLGIEGQVNINIMLNDIEFLLKEIEKLKAEKDKYYYEWKHLEANMINKIEELEKQDKESKLSHNYLVIPVLQSLLEGRWE